MRINSLYAFGATIDEDITAGRVLRAVCGQEVENLSYAEMMVINVIKGEEKMHQEMMSERGKAAIAARLRRKKEGQNND